MIDFDERMRELTYIWNDKESKFRELDLSVFKMAMDLWQTIRKDLDRDESRVEPEPEKPGKSSKSKTRVILARTRVPELQVRVLVAGFSMDAAILFSH